MVSNLAYRFAPIILPLRALGLFLILVVMVLEMLLLLPFISLMGIAHMIIPGSMSCLIRLLRYIHDKQFDWIDYILDGLTG